MAKLTVSRLLETSRLLATQAGQQLSELITYTNDTTEQIIRALRQGLTVDDNFNALSATLSLQHNTEQIVDTSGRTPSYVIVGRVVSSSVGVDAFTWYIDNNNRLVVKVGFTTPVPTSAVNVTVIIFFS